MFNDDVEPVEGFISVCNSFLPLEKGVYLELITYKLDLNGNSGEFDYMQTLEFVREFSNIPNRSVYFYRSIENLGKTLGDAGVTRSADSELTDVDRLNLGIGLLWFFNTMFMRHLQDALFTVAYCTSSDFTMHAKNLHALACKLAKVANDKCEIAESFSKKIVRPDMILGRELEVYAGYLLSLINACSDKPLWITEVLYYITQLFSKLELFKSIGYHNVGVEQVLEFVKLSFKTLKETHFYDTEALYTELIANAKPEQVNS